MEIKGKVALVTGSAKRVGKSIALALARKGAHVLVHYRTSKQEALSTVDQIRQMGVQSWAVRADLSSVKQIHQLVNQAHRHFTGIDICVHSASVFESTPFGKISELQWDSHADPNLKGIFFLSQEVAKDMRRKKSGKIITIIDSDVHQPYADYLPYLVSKAGLVGLTVCLAKELAPNIQVNGVAPGPVLLQDHWGPAVVREILKQTPLKRIGSPEDIAQAVLFCVEGTDFMTGAVIPVDGGQHIA